MVSNDRVTSDLVVVVVVVVVVGAGIVGLAVAREWISRRPDDTVTVLEREAAPALHQTGHGMIYPVPDPELPFLGVHITSHIDGSTTLGPTAMIVGARDAYSLRRVNARDAVESLTWPGTWRVARRYWRVGVDEIRMAARYMPGLTLADLDGSEHAGVLAQAVGRDGSLVDDFVISRDGPVSHVRNAPSPAATSAFALAAELVDRVSRSGV